MTELTQRSFLTSKQSLSLKANTNLSRPPSNFSQERNGMAT